MGKELADALSGMQKRDADAHRRDEMLIIEFHCGRRRLADLLCDAEGFIEAVRAVQDDEELVAAYASGGVLMPNGVADALGEPA